MKEHQKFPASVSAIIFNDQGQILLVSPDGQSHWQVITGWLEEETVYHGIIREIQEELGHIDVQVVDILDAHIFSYENAFPLISIFALVRYIQGDIAPSDDIEGYIWRWFEEAELKNLDIVSPYQFEIFEKAIFLINMYKENPSLPFWKYKWKSIT